MFQSRILYNLAVKYKDLFSDLVEMEDILGRRFTGMDDAVHALMLSVAGGEPLLLIGPPGTAKSRLIRAFCGMIGLLDENDPSKPHDLYFEYLLTPFTEPGELFGFFDIPKVVDAKRMERLDTGMMQNAEVVYLDEVFNGSSAILNSILSFLNERMFHDYGTRKKVAMECLFAATNDVPDTPELRAVFDRFVLRCHVDNIDLSPESMGQLLRKGWRETYGTHDHGRFSSMMEGFKDFRHEIKRATDAGELEPSANHPYYRKLTQLIHYARQYELSEVSNRRLIKMVFLMLIHRIFQAVKEDDFPEDMALGSAQLALMPRFFLDRFDDELAWKMVAAAGD